ncbi:hypothetical protein ACP4OV_005106 [Aristida adscensionis]
MALIVHPRSCTGHPQLGQRQTGHAMAARVPGVTAVRLASRLQLATSFFPSSSSRRRRGGSAGPPPALMVDVRVVIRRHFPAVAADGPCGGAAARVAVVEKVAEDIALRRRPSRKLRVPEQVGGALAEDVLPRVRHAFDRRAVVAAGREISAHVAAACADPRLAEGGAHVLVLVDTFACPMEFHPPPPPPPPVPWKMMRTAGAQKSFVVVRTIKPCMELELESGFPAKKAPPPPPPQQQQHPIGVIGDGRPKPVEERFEGWLPW